MSQKNGLDSAEFFDPLNKVLQSRRIHKNISFRRTRSNWMLHMSFPQHSHKSKHHLQFVQGNVWLREMQADYLDHQLSSRTRYERSERIKLFLFRSGLPVNCGLFNRLLNVAGASWRQRSQSIQVESTKNRLEHSQEALMMPVP